MSKSKFCNVSSVKEIMEKMGFNKNAPINTQKAFLKHLLNNYNDTHDDKKKNTSSKVIENEQLDLFKKAS